MNNFRELKVWQKGIELVKEVYSVTSKFPNTEQYVLVQQICRAVVSIPSNIAEGSGRKTKKDFEHFLSISLGSSFELETQLIISLELGYIRAEDYEKIESSIHEIQKMIRGLQKSLN